jgi:hypothetical protein
VEQALRRADKHPPGTSAVASVAGRTPFGLAKVAWHVGDGIATLDDATLSGPGSHIALSGRLDLRHGTTDMKALARQAGTDGVPNDAGPQVGFVLTGTMAAQRFELRETRTAPASAANGSSAPLP